MSQLPTYDELLNKLQTLESSLRSGNTLTGFTHDKHDLYRILFQKMLYEVHIWELVRDEDGAIKTWRLIDANPVALNNWGKNLDDIKGLTTDEIFPNAEATRLFMPTVKGIFADRKPSVWENYFSGTDQTLHMVSIPFGEIFISCGVDVTDIKKIEFEVEKSQQRLEIATKAAKIGVWEYDIASDSGVWDDSMYEIYGVEPWNTKLPFHIWSDSIHRDDADRAIRQLHDAIASVSPFNSEFRILRSDNGEIRYIQADAVVQTNEAGEPITMIGVNIDITDRKKSEQKIETLAYVDTLTGLPNRSMINDRLSQSIGMCGRTKKYSALIFIDLDNFKHVNDTAGHAVGDELLLAFATRIKAYVRRGDTFGRFGGDEFVIILNSLDECEATAASNAENFALKVVDLIQKPFAFSIGSHSTTASFGITIFNDKAALSEVLRKADLAMYKAKASGRNAVHFFDHHMQKRIMERVELEKTLVNGINSEDFDVYYQIQVDDAGVPRGAEALLRWNHPFNQFISPTVFIPIAEESGHIKKLGRWVFRKVCHDLKQVIGSLVTESFVISINISAIQVYDHDFVETVRNEVLESGISPAQIKLELTETALFRECALCLQVMQKLKEIDIKFSLDDFGTGYSSLTHLKELPMDELKIDQSFVRDIITNADSAAIARSVIALADSLGLEVIAEGVENADQMEKLRQMGCRAYQGFFFSRPLPLDEFVTFLKGNQLMA